MFDWSSKQLPEICSGAMMIASKPVAV